MSDTAATDPTGEAPAEPIRWTQHLPVSMKMLGAFGIMLVAVLASGGAMLVAQSNLADANKWTAHTYTVLRTFDNLRLAAGEQEARLEDAAILGLGDGRQAAALTPQSFDQTLAELRGLTIDNPRQQTRLNEIATLLAQWQNSTVKPAQAAFAKGVTGPDVGRMLFLGRPLFTQLRSEVRAGQAEEQQLLGQRISRVKHLLTLAQRVGWGSLIASILIVILAQVFVRREITGPLRRLTELMTNLVNGEKRFAIAGLARKDELGALARALLRFRTFAEELDRVGWVKSRVAEVVSGVQRAETPDAFAAFLMETMGPVLRAQIGLLYLAEPNGETFHYAGGFGHMAADVQARQFRLGEGLIGQCAASGNPTLLDHLPPDYFQLRSGSGAMAPRAVWVLPVTVKDQVLGILEFATVTDFGAADRLFIEAVLPPLGLALESLNRALRMRELLDETRAQAAELRASEESLRAQEEELRVTNESLHDQAARLRASDEELRVQSEELQASNEELRQRTDQLQAEKTRVEALQVETEAKAQEVEQASRYKSQFLANMSHELRTPLNSLLILSRELAHNQSGMLGDEDVESARYIHEAGSSLLSLINDILDLSKIEAGKMLLAPQEVPVGDILRDLQRHFRHVAQEKQLDFTVTAEPGLPDTIVTDPGKLAQITNNLLSNAFKFTSQGAVSVRVAPRLDQILIMVRDSGIGIPAEKLASVFLAFEQVDAGTSRQYGGTGLGLAIARNLARALGGDLTVESEPGRGSCFTLALPLRLGEDQAQASAPPLPAAAPAPVPVPVAAATAMPAAAPRLPPANTPIDDPLGDDRRLLRTGMPSILIVEDDLRFGRILLDVVRSKKYAGLAAADGETGLALARRFKPQGILLDVMMPQMDGWAVLQQLKDDPATRHIPVHFISATEEAGRALAAGAVGFLTKPVSREDIASVFSRFEHFSGARMRRVLTVDDEESVRDSVRTLIASDEVEVVEAASGAEALQLLKTSDFDCIVLDFNLSDTDGLAFLDQARAQGPVPPVVIYSGREFSKEENLRLHEYTDSVVIKGARSSERLVDEVSLFLHSMREPAAASRQSKSLEGRIVLLVDDDVRNLFALAKALRAQGLVVRVAQSGQQALEMLAAQDDVDIVLMDIMMPGMDGYEAIRRIRAEEEHKSLPIIALTAKAMMDDRQKCLDAGASDYLPKPVDLDRLTSQMQIWLGSSSSHG